MYKSIARLAVASTVALAMTAGAYAASFTISSGLPKSHNWVGHHMDPFMAAIEKDSGGQITFTPFYAGELTRVGQELDALQNGTIQVAAPLLAPYHEGRFPLSDVTQLPTYKTTSPMVTRAFQKMLDSKEPLRDGKTFYDYEISSKGIHAWAIGATAAYSISTVDKQLKQPADFKGLTLRAGSAIHTIAANELGATPVTMPATGVYEAMSRGTVAGILISISDWPAYSIDQLLKHTITDVAIGHWESYLAMSDDAWNQLSKEQQALWDKDARQIAMQNADYWEEQVGVVTKESKDRYGAEFTSISALPQDMQDHIASAAAKTWVSWIEKVEANGHPAKAAAKLYAQLITAEGGELPKGIAEYLGL